MRIGRTALKIVGGVASAALFTLGLSGPAHAQNPNPGKTLTGAPNPAAIAIAPNGDIYVANGSGSVINVFDKGTTTPNATKQITGLSRPHGLAFDATGKLFVANTSTNSVLVYDLTNSRSTPVRTLTGVTTPLGVAIDSTGEVFASDGLLPTVQVFDPGQDTPNSGKQLTMPNNANAGSVAVDANDNVYVAWKDLVGTPNKVFGFDKDATTSDPDLTLTGSARPAGVAFDSAGLSYVAQNTSATLVYPKGQTAPDAGAALNGPSGSSGTSVTVGDDDTVYVGTFTGALDEVLVFDPPGPPTPPSFECTHGPQAYTVPSWADQINVTLKGGQGGGDAGGRGGSTQTLMDVTPNSTLQVNVGCGGGNAAANGVGGFNGGAAAGRKGTSTGAHLGGFNGGGGATDIRIGDCAVDLTCGLAARVLVAGGGGGEERRGSSIFPGGGGGSPAGLNGHSDSAIGVGKPGSAGNQSAGGAGGGKAFLSSGTAGSAGSSGSGGVGGDSGASRQTGPGAGGGGGLFGGGGGGSGNAITGAGIGGAGGGGSSGVGPAGGSILHSTTFDNSSSYSDGSVDIAPVVAPLSVTTTTLADGATTAPYSQQLNATGGVPGYTWAVTTGSLPAGLILSPGGEIQGTPTATGTSSFTVTVTDQLDHTAPKNLSILVDAGIVITTPSVPAGSVGASYTATLASSGGGGVASGGWAVTAGSLPAGLSLDADTGVISGTPTAAGSPTVTVTVTGVDASTAEAPFTFSISPALAIATTSPLNPAVVGQNYAATLDSSGGIGPFAWSVTAGSLPAGLSLAADTGQITGKPTATGTSHVTFTVTDSLTTEASKPFAITVAAPLSVSTKSLASGTIDKAYSAQLSAKGGVKPYSWLLTKGNLPAGLSLAQSTGKITGKPSAVGTSKFTVKVTDSLSHAATKALSIKVAPIACTLTTSALPAGHRLPRAGTETIVRSARASAGCKLRIATGATNRSLLRGDLRFATFGINPTTGKIVVTTHGYSGVKVMAHITAVPRSATRGPSPTWSRTWRTK